jgi:curved DNA-binding protein CbpA
MQKAVEVTNGRPNLYELLQVENDVEPEALKVAYRQLALVEHPDKGGDQDKFDAILHAFNLLQDPQRRLEYDEELARAASQARLVEGAPTTRSTGEGVAHKKTAPTPGSKRQKDWHKQSEEWAGEKKWIECVAEY